jgi:ornithine carbamoyltransferase
MQTTLKGRHFITTQEWTTDELESVFALAAELKAARAAGTAMRVLPDKTLYMIFFDSSTRIAIRHCAYGEGNRYLREVARWSRVPVINMQCDVYHPCQILADYLTIREKLGASTRGLKLGVAWTSAPNYVRPISVPQSLILMMPRFGIDVTLAYPPEFRLMPEIEEQARRNAVASGARFEIVNDFEAAFLDADVVIPKSWGPLLHTTDRQAGLELIEKYPAWRCDEAHMALGKRHCLYMHPLPADRGREVTDGVIDGPNSVVYDEAENRLHVQKALMALVM